MVLGLIRKQLLVSDMRPILIGDALAMSRALMQISPENRRAACLSWLFQAECADKYRKRFERLHPVWGNGSLMGVATAHCADALTGHSVNQPEFSAALVEVLQAIQAWRAFKELRADQSGSSVSR